MSIPDIGWANKDNGELLQAMTEEGLDILLTVDKNLRFQQNLDKYEVQIVVLRTFDNRYKTLIPHIPRIEKEIKNLETSEKWLEIDLRK